MSCALSVSASAMESVTAQEYVYLSLGPDLRRVGVADRGNGRRPFVGARNLLFVDTGHQLGRLLEDTPSATTPFLLEALAVLQKHLIVPGSPTVSDSILGSWELPCDF